MYIWFISHQPKINTKIQVNVPLLKGPFLTPTFRFNCFFSNGTIQKLNLISQRHGNGRTSELGHFDIELNTSLLKAQKKSTLYVSNKKC